MSPGDIIKKFSEIGGEVATRDDIYYQKKVEVLEVRVAGDRMFYMGNIPMSQFWEELKNEKIDFVQLGDKIIRKYEIREAGPRTVDFCKLPAGTQAFVLKQKKDLFKDVEGSFSPKIREYLERLRGGELGDNREAMGGRL